MSTDSTEIRAMTLMSQALDYPSNQRVDWVKKACQEDPALLAHVLALLEIDSATDNRVLRTGGAGQDIRDTPDPEQIGPYRVVELIGRGGMGAVYKATRDIENFDHTVAIKVIKPGAMASILVKRFQRERQTLANLKHPNIAQLYDGGQTDDGAPYIVMEYIDGEPLSEWSNNRALNLEDRLWLFRDLCNAVRHAHQSLIIHRDLTPSNVIVTQTGTVKLIDFGIAKPYTENETGHSAQVGLSTASLSFTPGFAAPEREHESAPNTLSDIYSLGKLLEDLVSNQPLPPDLKAIIGKSTAYAPENRYPSVDSLMNDLDNLHAHKPVEARNGGTLYRLGKFMHRQRLAVSTASIFVICLSAALANTMVQYQRADRERIAADRRFEDVRELAKFMMFDLYDTLLETPGNTRAIELLAAKSQTYLESLSTDTRASIDISLEAGLGFKRLADIFGNPINQNLGRRGEAGIMLDKAQAHLEDLLSMHTGNTEVMRALAEVKFANAVHKYVADDANETAHALALEAATLYETLLNRPNIGYGERSQFIRAKMMSAVPLPFIGRDSEGVEILRDTQKLATELLSEFPGDTRAMSLLGSMNVELARALVRLENNTGETHNTLPYWDEAIALRLAAHAAKPADGRPYRSLVIIYAERSAALRANGQYDASLADLDASEKIAIELLALDPDDAWLKRMQGGNREEKIRTLSYAGRHEEAVALASDALIKARSEYEVNVDSPGIIREWGYTQVLIAYAYYEAGLLKEACETSKSARTTWDRLDKIGDGISQADKAVSIANLETLENECLNP